MPSSTLVGEIVGFMEVMKMHFPRFSRKVGAAVLVLATLVLVGCDESLETESPSQSSGPGLRATVVPGQPDSSTQQPTPPASPIIPADLPPASTGPADDADPGDTLLLDSFAVIEFQYPQEGGHYFYAPLIHVTAAFEPLTVTRLAILFPDGSHPPDLCGSLRVTSAGRDLLREVYGDYELTVDYGDGRRAGTDDFLAQITYVDGRGRPHVLEARAPARAGVLPGTYTGRAANDWYLVSASGC